MNKLESLFSGSGICRQTKFEWWKMAIKKVVGWFRSSSKSHFMESNLQSQTFKWISLWGRMQLRWQTNSICHLTDAPNFPVLQAVVGFLAKITLPFSYVVGMLMNCKILGSNSSKCFNWYSIWLLTHQGCHCYCYWRASSGVVVKSHICLTPRL